MSFLRDLFTSINRTDPALKRWAKLLPANLKTWDCWHESTNRQYYLGAIPLWDSTGLREAVW